MPFGGRVDQNLYLGVNLPEIPSKVGVVGDFPAKIKMSRTWYNFRSSCPISIQPTGNVHSFIPNYNLAPEMELLKIQDGGAAILKQTRGHISVNNQAIFTKLYRHMHISISDVSEGLNFEISKI